MTKTRIYIIRFSNDMLSIVFLFLQMFGGNAQTDETHEQYGICIPHVVVYWERAPLEQHVQHCIVTNFGWAAQNKTIFEPYIDTYIGAHQAGAEADQDDDKLYYKKRKLMTILRNTKLKSSHHIHAIKKCAAISHRMPVMLMDAYSNEIKMMAQVADTWTHHIKQDLKQCNKTLLDLVFRQHRHLEMHIMHDLHNYEEARDIVEQRREHYTNMTRLVTVKRNELMETLARLHAPTP